MIPLILPEASTATLHSPAGADETLPPEEAEAFDYVFGLLASAQSKVEPSDENDVFVLNNGQTEEAASVDVEDETAVIAFATAPQTNSPQSKVPHNEPTLNTVQNKPQQPTQARAEVDVTPPQQEVVVKVGQMPDKTPLPSKAGSSLAQAVVEGRLPTQIPQRETQKQQQPMTVELPKAVALPEAAQAIPKAMIAQQNAQSGLKDKPGVLHLGKKPMHVQEAQHIEVRASSSTAAPSAAMTPPPAVALTQSMITHLENAEKHMAVTTPDEVELLPGLAARERASSAVVQTVAVSATTGGTDIARNAANQIAAAINSQQGRATEIALSPKELGRVRLSITAIDSTITVNILAERPETTDLLRRHIDALAHEFQSLGYEDISFAFGGDAQSNSDPDTADQNFAGSATDSTVGQDIVPPSGPQSNSGLDLRL